MPAVIGSEADELRVGFGCDCVVVGVGVDGVVGAGVVFGPFVGRGNSLGVSSSGSIPRMTTNWPCDLPAEFSARIESRND